jgi:hypothetical protein
MMACIDNRRIIKDGCIFRDSWRWTKAMNGPWASCNADGPNSIKERRPNERLCFVRKNQDGNLVLNGCCQYWQEQVQAKLMKLSVDLKLLP